MRSESQGIKLISGGQDFSVMAIDLPLADHVHRFDAGNEDAGAAKDLEPEHRPYDSFDSPMILLDDIVEIREWSNPGADG